MLHARASEGPSGSGSVTRVSSTSSGAMPLQAQICTKTVTASTRRCRLHRSEAIRRPPRLCRAGSGGRHVDRHRPVGRRHGPAHVRGQTPGVIADLEAADSSEAVGQGERRSYCPRDGSNPQSVSATEQYGRERASDEPPHQAKPGPPTALQPMRAPLSTTRWMLASARRSSSVRGALTGARGRGELGA